MIENGIETKNYISGMSVKAENDVENVSFDIETKNQPGSSKVCSICHKTFASQVILDMHTKIAHSVVSLECEKCLTLFSNKHEFMVHDC